MAYILIQQFITFYFAELSFETDPDTIVHLAHNLIHCLPLQRDSKGVFRLPAPPPRSVRVPLPPQSPQSTPPSGEVLYIDELID